MNIIIPPRSARTGHLRAKLRSARLRARHFKVRALRGLLVWFLDNSLYAYGQVHLPCWYEVRLWLRRRAIALLKRLPRPARPKRRRLASAELEALVQRQYGWRNAGYCRREGRRHGAL